MIIVLQTWKQKTSVIVNPSNFSFIKWNDKGSICALHFAIIEKAIKYACDGDITEKTVKTILGMFFIKSVNSKKTIGNKMIKI